MLEGIDIYVLAKDRADRDVVVEALLDEVGLKLDVLSRYPHESSGGQRVRIGMLRALAV